MSLMPSCREIAGLVSDAEDGRLGVSDRARFWVHLSTCPPCRAWAAQVQLTRTMVHATGEVDVTDAIPDDLLAAYRSWTRAGGGADGGA
jgi:predicted anti-sigma-YlaC factor YlaD